MKTDAGECSLIKYVSRDVVFPSYVIYIHILSLSLSVAPPTIVSECYCVDLSLHQGVCVFGGGVQLAGKEVAHCLTLKVRNGIYMIHTITICSFEITRDICILCI